MQKNNSTTVVKSAIDSILATTGIVEIISSTTPGFSSMGQTSRSAVLAELIKLGYSAKITIINCYEDLQNLVARKPDLVVLGMMRTPFDCLNNSKIWLSDYLELHGITHTGSPTSAHMLESNKSLAKQRVLDLGLESSAYFVAKTDQIIQRSDIQSMTYPLFIKPSRMNGGVGIDKYSVVNNFKQCTSKIQSIFLDLRSDALIEEYLCGREFSVAILKNMGSDSYKIMPIELVAPEDDRGHRMLSSKVKQADAEVATEVTDMVLHSKLSSLAIQIFHALGARDYGRIDIRLDRFGVPQFLEANLIPSLISFYGSFPKACKIYYDMEYPDMIKSIVELALARKIVDKISATV